MQEQPNVSEHSDDNRSEPRRRTLKGGKIIFNNNQCVLNCTIRDLSKAGCRLSVPGQTGLPTEFELHLPSSDDKYQCQIIWRKSFEVGVKFKSWFGIG